MYKKFLHPYLFAVLIISIIGLTFQSCKNANVRAEDLPESVSSYVYGFTSGIISKADPIRVRFASTVAETDNIGEEVPASVISFSPPITGKAVWEDQQTLRFDPNEYLNSGTTYIATVNLKKVIPDVPSDAKSFEFDFRTKDQYFELTVDGLEAPLPNDLTKQELIGNIYTADIAEAEEVEKSLEASQKGQDLEITWEHGTDQRTHQFRVKNINRGEKASSLDLSWDGTPLGADIKGEKKVEVPSLSDFKVTEAKITGGQEPYIMLHFSDPLKESQDLSGLVSLANYSGNLRFLIDGNQVRLYPSSKLAGEHKVTVRPGVRNINDKRMKDASEWVIQFEDRKPQVRLVGQGVVMPNSNGLIFPFEAVSLSAIEVEVFKIFNNNILQFLQTNNLGESGYDLYRVGRVILQKKLPLKKLNPNANVNEWTRYAIDLSQLIEEDPEAIYQIRIGFRPSYATYLCGGTADDSDNLTIMEDPIENGEEIKSIMDSWYGLDGYYQGYRWEHREDPCQPAYYNAERFVSRNVVASNLGLLAKGGKDNNYLITVTDLRTTQPISGANLEFYDFQQQLISKASTDTRGISEIKLKRKPFVVVARASNQKGYLRMEDGNAISLSRFDVSGAVTQKGLKGFMYGERGVWRPGDSVYLNFILEDKNDRLPANYPVTLELFDPRGQLYERRTSNENVKDIYPLYFRTKTDDPTGNWVVKVKAGGAAFDRIIKIETVKPNRLKIDLDFGGKKEISVKDEPIRVGLNAQWLHGAPASNLKTKTEVQLSKMNTTFEKYDRFEFDDPARSFSSNPAVLFDGKLNSEGNANFEAKLLGNKQAPGKLRASFKTRVFEKTGEFSTDNFSLPYNPYSAYAGISIPKDKYGQKRIDINKNGKVDFVVVDDNGKPVQNRKLSVGLYRVEWRWWWDRSYDNISRYNSSNHLDALETKELTTTSNGEVQWDLKVDDWGRYLVRVCDTETGHCSGDFFYSGYPWNDTEGENREAAAMLSFSADKEKYAVGETVKLTIPMGKVGRALVTIENGTEVVESFWVDATSGENTFTFKTTPEMAPTVYAHVTLIQPHAKVENDLPIRLYGVIPIGVEDPTTRLTPKINMPEELRPQETVSIEVSESNGKPMAYTLAVVDEGLLSLTRFKTPDPWSSFYAREALGVKTWDIYDEVLGAYGGKLERVLSIGGDVEVRPGDADDSANRFEPVVIHLGPFYLKKGEKAKHNIKMPNYVGAVRTMVVAANNGAYGNAEKTTPVRKPLMVLATLPRVLGPGETLKLPVNVFAMANKVKNATISVRETSGLAQVVGSTSQNLTFNRPGDKLATFDIKVSERIGVAKFIINAAGNGEKASQEIEIQVRNPNPVVTDVRDKVLQAGEEWSQDFAPIGMDGTNENMLEISSIPPINLGKRLDYLLRYPYGCLEQTLSGGFPQLYVGKLMELDDQQKEKVPKNIRATIDRLKQFQTAQGGFAYWPGNANPNQWATSYAGHFLLEAKALGYSVPPNLLDRWVDFQKKTSRLWDPKLKEYGFYSRRSFELDQAYRLFTLALAQQPDLPAMNRLRETNSLTKQARWRLAAAYALAGKTEIAQQLINGMNTEVEDYQELSYTYGSGTRDRAMILETLVLLNKKTEAAGVVKYLSDELSANRWHSTQTISYSLLAIGKFVGNSDISDKLQFAYQLSGRSNVNAGSDHPLMQIELPADEKGSFKIKNTSGAVLFARIIQRGKPVTGAETSSSSQLQIVVNYKDLSGKAIDPSSLPQGTDFLAEVKISHPGIRPIPYEELALSQIFPSGWEILNTRMDDVQNLPKSSDFEYQDFRDDRVYTFFDLRQKNNKVFTVQLNAAYQGRYYLPAVSCEAMYDNSINAREAGQWVQVTQPKQG